ncbi:flippase-like domain-containing protein [Metallumcola ferriviriculae]|uniref:Phosphatidylglycerol lysyltransferase n=1 Tax=Metallumcola ferriviriculae TaxID=3039180 RepID=A0AAU0UJD8_9FIRM|nr:flippase-like domain-containing protein [Desulfitibacteraceae bacterium MK1]
MKNFIKNKVIKRTILYFFGVLILLFIGKSLYSNWAQIKGLAITMDYSLLILSLFLYIFYLFLDGIGWNFILHALNVKLRYRDSITIFYLSQMARYLPGGVINIFGRVYLAQKKNISKTHSGASIVLEMFMKVFSAFVLSLFFLGHLYREWLWGFLVLLLVIFLVFFDLRLLNYLLNVFSNKFGNKFVFSLQRKTFLGILFYYISSWFIFGMAFKVFCNSLGIYGKSLVLVSVFPASWIAGFLSPIPGGIGVREGVLSYFLSFYFDKQLAYIMALLSRVWLIVGELSAGLVVFVFYSIVSKLMAKQNK